MTLRPVARGSRVIPPALLLVVLAFPRPEVVAHGQPPKADPPAKAAISTSRPSSAKYLRCCAMISGKYGNPSEAVATLILLFSGAWADAACGSVASKAQDRIQVAAWAMRMGRPPGAALRPPHA